MITEFIKRSYDVRKNHRWILDYKQKIPSTHFHSEKITLSQHDSRLQEILPKPDRAHQINQSINKPTNQQINQSTNQLINQPTNLSINQSIDQAFIHSFNKETFYTGEDG